MPFDSGMFGSGLGGILGGMFGHSGRPYDKAMEQYQQYGNMAAGAQQPYANAGQGAIGNYQQWLQGQKDPSQFINNLMSGYQESPYAKYQQQQSMNAGTNAASASGLSGSTPMMQQLQQNAAGITSEDQNKWLQNVLGVNTQYGQGQNNLMQGGQNAANHLSDIYGNMGNKMGEQTYNREASKNNDWWNTLGGIGSLFGAFL